MRHHKVCENKNLSFLCPGLRREGLILIIKVFISLRFNNLTDHRRHELMWQLIFLTLCNPHSSQEKSGLFSSWPISWLDINMRRFHEEHNILCATQKVVTNNEHKKIPNTDSALYQALVTSSFSFLSKINNKKILSCHHFIQQANRSSKPIINPPNIYLLKVSNRNNRKSCEICSKSTIKTVERHWTYFTPFSCVFMVDFEQVNVS